MRATKADARMANVSRCLDPDGNPVGFEIDAFTMDSRPADQRYWWGAGLTLLIGLIVIFALCRASGLSLMLQPGEQGVIFTMFLEQLKVFRPFVIGSGGFGPERTCVESKGAADEHDSLRRFACGSTPDWLH